MHIHRLRRHDDPLPSKVLRSLLFLLSALLFATAVFGFMRDAEAQWQAYSLPNSGGGLNYYSGQGQWDNSGGMLGLGVEMMRMGNQAEMHRRQMAAQYGWYGQPQYQAPRETWTPESARDTWGKTYGWE